MSKKDTLAVGRQVRVWVYGSEEGILRQVKMVAVREGGRTARTPYATHETHT